MNILFFVFALLAVAAALGVVLIKQPLYSAFCLVGNMVVLAALYAMLGAHFLSAVQIIVYAGAIMVLVIFVIMLLSVSGEEGKPVGTLLGLLACVFTVFFLVLFLPELSDSFAGPDRLNPVLQGDVASVGRVVYSKYLFPFEAASVLIIAAIAGAVMLAKREKLSPKSEDLIRAD